MTTIRNLLINLSLGAGLLAVQIFVSVDQKALAAELPTDSAHAVHLAAAAGPAGGQIDDALLAEILARMQRLEAIIQQRSEQPAPAGAMPIGPGNMPGSRTMPGMGSGANSAPLGMADMDMATDRKGGMGGGAAVADQLAELRAQMQRLEAAVERQAGSSSGAKPMSGAPAMGPGTKPMQGQMAGTSARGADAPAFGGVSGAMKPTGGLGDAASPPGGEMGMMRMMSMMDKMMGMMDKMISRGGGAMPAGTPAAGMSGGGGMGMDRMKMAGKRDAAGSTSATMPSDLPGFPGASEIYHVGATGFFLDSAAIELTADQQAALNRIKEKSIGDIGAAQGGIDQAEEELWIITGSDRPDARTLETKLREIEKLKVDKRIAFIRSVGDAARVLTDDQRNALLGAGASGAAQLTAPQGSDGPMNPQGGMGSTDPKAGTGGMGENSMGNMGGARTPTPMGNGVPGDM